MTTHLDPRLDAEPVRIGIGGSEDFLSLVPYCLGYQPDEQLVLMLVERKQVVATMAVPLDSPDDPATSRRSVLSVLEQVADPLVMLACWSEDAALADEALDVAEQWVGPERVLDRVVVGPVEWRSRSAGGPSGWTADLATTAAATEAVVAGLNAEPSRDEMLRALRGPSSPCPDDDQRHRAAEAELLELTPAQCDQLAVDLQERLLAMPPAGRDAADLARLAVLALDPAALLPLWQALGHADTDDAQALWVAVAAGAPARWSNGALLTAGFSAWLNGNGVVLLGAVELAERRGAAGGPLAMLAAVQRDAVPPSVWGHFC